MIPNLMAKTLAGRLSSLKSQGGCELYQILQGGSSLPFWGKSTRRLQVLVLMLIIPGTIAPLVSLAHPCPRFARPAFSEVLPSMALTTAANPISMHI